MRHLLPLLAVGLFAQFGCGPNAKTEYSGPAVTPLTGRNVPAGYGAPGEAPPEGGTKPPAKPMGGR
jgi:hypothetical protein